MSAMAFARRILPMAYPRCSTSLYRADLGIALVQGLLFVPFLSGKICVHRLTGGDALHCRGRQKKCLQTAAGDLPRGRRPPRGLACSRAQGPDAAVRDRAGANFTAAQAWANFCCLEADRAWRTQPPEEAA